MLFLSASLLTGCAKHAMTQKVSLESGDFGVTELATVRSVDPIILDNDRSRFNLAFGELAVSIVTETGSGSAEIWQETARLFGDAFAAELEEYIRGLSCVYTVAPEGRLINGIVVDQIRSGGDLILDDDGGTLITSYRSEREKTASVSAFQAISRPVRDRGAETEMPEIEEFSIISNCIIGVHRDTTVRLVQTGSRAIILPQRSAPPVARL